MASAYPGSLDSFPTNHVDDAGEVIHAQTTNDLADAVNKIETAVGVTPFAVVTDTYSASITPNAALGQFHKITVTNATAFTINAPTNPTTGRLLVFDILNSSGGAMGTITWNAAFKMAGAFTNPASTKRRTIRFYYDGTNWVELSRAAADI